MRKFLRNFVQGAKALPIFARRPFKRETPSTEILGRTGDARYLPVMAQFGTRAGKKGREQRVQMANRLDDISYADYDRARFYPVVRDGIRSFVNPIGRANIHFVCDNQDAAELAQQELAPLISDLARQSIRGGMEFGWHAAEIRPVAKFDIFVSTGLASNGVERNERYYPFIWSIHRFAHFDPADTRVLVDTVNGDFAGIRQFIVAKHKDVPGSKCVIYVHDREFDNHYGVPLDKPAIPFIDLAISLFDSMGKYADLFAVPGMVGRYPLGRTSFGDNSVMENADLMQTLLEAIGSGHRISLPSNTWDNGEQKWGLDFFAPVSTSQGFTEMIELVNNMIRLSIGADENAGAETQKVGGVGDQGGGDKIELHLQNMETYLDAFLPEILKIANMFRVWNFGHDCPPIKAFYEPLDMNVTKTILAAIVELLSSGQPIQDSEGNLIYFDYGKILQDKGIPTVSVSGKRLAQQLMDSANQQLGQARNGDQGQGGQAGQDLVNQLTPDPNKPDTQLTAQKAAYRLLLTALDSYETAPGIRAKLKAAVIKLDDEFEGKHPRNDDGTFKTKEQMEAEAAAKHENVSGESSEMGDYRKRMRARYESVGVTNDALKNIKDHLHSELQDPETKDRSRAQAQLLAVQDVLDSRAVAKRDAQGKPAGPAAKVHPDSISKEDLAKAKEDKKYHEQGAWTRGRLSNVVEHQGDIYVHGKDGKLTPAKHEDLIPKLRAKLDERKNEAYAGMKRRLAGDDGSSSDVSPDKNHTDQLHELRSKFSEIEAKHRPVNWKAQVDRANANVNMYERQISYIQGAIDRYQGEVDKGNSVGYYTKAINKYKKDLDANKKALDKAKPIADALVKEIESKIDPATSSEYQDAKAQIWQFAHNNRDVLRDEFESDIAGGREPHELHFDSTLWGHGVVAERFTTFGNQHLAPVISKYLAETTDAQNEIDRLKAVSETKNAERNKMWEEVYKLPHDSPERNELWDKLNKGDAEHSAAVQAAYRRLGEIKAAHYDRMRQMLTERHGERQKLPAKLEIDGSKGFRRGARETDGQFQRRKAAGSPYENIEKGVTEFVSMVPERMRNQLDKALTRIYDSSARAHYSSGTIRVVHSDKSTIHHELMHGVETNPDELAISKAYLESRREPGERLSTIYKGRKEMGYKDKFSNHYTGKYYNAATEIMSMGVEGLLHGEHNVLTDDHGLAAHVLGRLMVKS